MSRAAKPGVLRFAPILFGFAALFVFGAGAFLQFQANERAGARVAAYVSGPPAGVPLERFNPATHTKDYGEALIVAQLDLGASVHLDPAIEGGPSALAVPMYGLRDGGEAMPRGIALFTGPRFVEGRITAADLEALAEGTGAVGPQIMLNGIADGPGDWAPRLQAAGLRAQSSLVLYPFVEGRRAALVAEGAAPIFGQFAWAGGLFGLLALALLALGATAKPDPARAAGAAGPMSAADEENARIEAALRGPIKRRGGRSPLRLVALAALIGGAGYAFRDRIDLARLQEAVQTRDFTLLRAVIRPASEGQGASLPDLSALVAQAPDMDTLIAHFSGLLANLPSVDGFFIQARIWGEAQIYAAQDGDLTAIAHLGLGLLGALALMSLVVRLARGLRPAKEARPITS